MGKQRPGEEKERGDAPAAADEPGGFAPSSPLQAESFSERAETVERLAFFFGGQERGSAAGDPEKDFEPTRLRRRGD